MWLPLVALTLPGSLANAKNGHLPSGLLREIGPAGHLHVNAARAFEALSAAAIDQGFHLTCTYGGTYRSFQAQRDLFQSRYTTTFDPAENTSDDSRTWEGRRWFKLRGVAAVATPGTSDHGLGLAVDLALGQTPSSDGPIDPAILAWLTENAWRYGWAWESESEPWHIRYVDGDAVPAAVLDFERTGSAEPPTYPTIRRASRGPYVSYLQRVLRICQPALVVDGLFGPRTDAATRSFQECVEIAVDGIVGPQTWAKIRDVGDGFKVARP